MDYKQAHGLACIMHEGQIRKYSGMPYITHPVAVANAFELESLKIVAILHDTIEDTSLTLGGLKDFGIDDDLIYVIDILTHKKNQSYFDYILDIKNVPMASLVKIEDIKHNVSDLNPGHLKDKYMLALHILME